jgi:hypothetical protein
LTSGWGNIAIGPDSLCDNTTGKENVVVGKDALPGNDDGSYNVAIGFEAMGYWMPHRSNNVAIGHSALYYNEDGDNVAIGSSALYNATSGSKNVVVGDGAGFFYGSGLDTLSRMSNSILIGCDTRPLADSDTNEIVIGKSAVGHGNNTTTIGNTSTTDSYIYGNIRTSGSGIFGSNVTVTGNISGSNLSGTNTGDLVNPITGSGSTGQLAVFNSGSGLTSGSNLTWSGSSLNVIGNTIISYTQNDGTTGLKLGKAGVSSAWILSDDGINLMLDSDNNGTGKSFAIFDNGGIITPLLIVQDDNNTGIGTATPGALLHLSKSAGANLWIIDTGNASYPSFVMERNQSGGSYNTSCEWYIPANSTNLQLYNGGQRFCITAAGNVGIGTNVPKSKLDVVGLPDYANNAAAITGGLEAGSFYTETGTNPKRVCVVY